MTKPGSACEPNVIPFEDPEEILSSIEQELFAMRFKRPPEISARTTLRVFGFLLIMGLFGAGLAATWYLETVAMEQRPLRHPQALISQAP